MTPLTQKQKALLATMGVTASQLIRAGVTASQLIEAGFMASQLIEAGFTASQLIWAGVTASQLIKAGVTASQLIEAGFTASQLIRAGVTASQLIEAGFTASPIRDLYTRIHNDLNSGVRQHRQSTFGNNVCGTPMCIAGHIVNVAGEVGWGLKEKLDYPVAALVIHTASHPDKPAPSFGSYPDEWALAYIAEMAAHEASKIAESES